MISDPESDWIVSPIGPGANHRIEFYDFSPQRGDRFEYSSTLNMSASGVNHPCNFRVLQNATDPKLNGMAVVAGLDGRVAGFAQHID